MSDQKIQLANERFSIRGKVTKIERTRSGDGFIHTVICAARDEFSQPNSYNFLHTSAVCGLNEVIDGFLNVSGFVRDFMYPDKTTGIMTKGSEQKIFMRWSA